MSAPIRVLVADDQRVVREGLEMLLGLMRDVDVVGSAADGEAALALTEQLDPDIILMDLNMPGCDGIEATRRLHDRDSRTRVIVLTTYADDRSVIAALRAGAKGFLTKDSGAQDIGAALGAVMRGHAALDPSVQHHLIDALSSEAAPTGAPDAPALPDGLTQREAEVLSLIAEGLANSEIAQRLYINETTVKTHINRIFAKTRTRDRAQAVVYAYRRGLAPR